MDVVKIWLRQTLWTPAAATLLGVGFLLGCLFRFPLVPWSFSDSNATIVGASLGAFIAVAMASWIAQRQARQKWRHTRDLLLMLVTEMTVRGVGLSVALTELRISKDEEEANRHFAEIIHRSKRLQSACARGADRIERLMPSLCDEDPVFAIAATDALSITIDTRDAFANLIMQRERLSYTVADGVDRVVYIDRVGEALSSYMNEMALVKAIISGVHWASRVKAYPD